MSLNTDTWTLIFKILIHHYKKSEEWRGRGEMFDISTTAVPLLLVISNQKLISILGCKKKRKSIWKWVWAPPQTIVFISTLHDDDDDDYDYGDYNHDDNDDDDNDDDDNDDYDNDDTR